MSLDFVTTWAFCWLLGFGIFAMVGIITHMPLPRMPWPFLIGALAGAWVIGPTVIYSLKR